MIIFTIIGVLVVITFSVKFVVNFITGFREGWVIVKAHMESKASL